MKFSNTTQKLVGALIQSIPLFIGILIIAYLGNKSFERFGMKGLIIYAIIIIYAQLATMNKNVRALGEKK